MQNVSSKRIKSIADLVPDKKNARKHNPRNIGMITDAIGQVGVGRSGVIDEDGNILVGNGTYEALAELGIEKIKVVKAAGNEWVLVQREGLSEEQKVKMALYDNRTAELADWDADILQEINEDDPEFMSHLFSTEEMDSIFDLNFDDPEALEGEDEAPEAPEKAVTKPGQIYQLGPHRLMCGDSTDKAQVEKLMNGEQADMVFTDPPYGMNLNTDWSKAKSRPDFAQDKKAFGGKKHRPVLGDNGDFSSNLIDCILRLNIKETFIFGADYFAEILPDKNDGSWIVWDKRLDESADKMYGSCFELCWSKQKHKREIARVKWAGIFGTEQEPEHKRFHPTQKPILLVKWFFNKWGKDGDLVIDLFGGAGSTLIACEKLNRKCHMMEIEPAYCDVIVERYKSLFPENEVRTLN